MKNIINIIGKSDFEQFDNIITASQYIKLYDLTNKYTSEDSICLDWGMGNGHFSYYLLKKNRKVYSFTLDEKSIKIRNNAGGGWGAGTAVSMEFVQGDGVGDGDAAGAKIKCERANTYNGSSDNDAKLEFYTAQADSYVKALTIDQNQTATFTGACNAGSLTGDTGTFGTTGGITLYRSGSHNYIDGGTDDFYIRSTLDDIVIQSADDVFIYTQGGEDAIVAKGNEGVWIYYNNSKKFETTSAGISVTGGGIFSDDVTVQGDIVGATDSYTKLLIHSDNPDGSVFTDSSASGHTITRGGDAYHKATQKKFGSS